MATALAVNTPLDPRTLPALRRRLGYTQAEIGALVGSNANEVSRLERALAPGELLDRIVGALADLAACEPAPQM